MQHGGDVQIIAAGRTAHSPQVSSGHVKQVRDTHSRQRLLQLQFRLGGKPRNGRLHIGVLVTGDQLIQMLAGEVLQVVLQRHALVGQQRYERIFPAVIGLQEAGNVVAGQIDALAAGQVIRRLARTGSGGEGPALADIRRFVGRLPPGVKAGGVDQIQHGSLAGRLLQQTVDQAVCLLADPAVQVGDQTAVERGTIDLRAVVVDAGAQEAVLHPEGIPHPRGVGQRNGAALVRSRQAHAVGVQKFIQLVQTHARRRFHLLQGSSTGAVGRHAQCVQDGHR